MERLRYNQRSEIAIPRWEVFAGQGEFPKRRFVLKDAEDFLFRWSINIGDKDKWEDYNALTDEHRSDENRIWCTNFTLARDMQKRFSKEIRDVIGNGYSLIGRFSCQAYNDYFIREKASKGIVYLHEPPSQGMVMFYQCNPQVNFELKATKEVDLEDLVKRIKKHLKQNWHLPRGEIK